MSLSISSARTLEHLHLNLDLAEQIGEEHIPELINAFGELQALRSLTMTGRSQCLNLRELKENAQVTRFRFRCDAFPHLERLATGRESLLHAILLGGLCRIR